MSNADGTPAQAAFPPDKETTSRDPIMKAPLMAVVAMAWDKLRAISGCKARAGRDVAMPKE